MYFEIDTTSKRAVDVWGEQKQIDVAIEECSELIAALIHYRRNRTSSEFVAEEIADVVIMMQQMALIFNLTNVNSSLARKMERLSKRLDMVTQDIKD
jgi:NTP pyrophosphatase (non-canonical NTP hydrolase)